MFLRTKRSRIAKVVKLSLSPPQTLQNFVANPRFFKNIALLHPTVHSHFVVVFH